MITRVNKQGDLAISVYAWSNKEIFIDRVGNQRVPTPTSYVSSWTSYPAHRSIPFQPVSFSFVSNFTRQILVESCDIVESFRWRN